MGSKVKLGSLLSLLTDYHANGAYKKLKENVELFDEPDYAVMIRTTNFEQGCFDSNLKYISEHAYNFLAKSKVHTGDIIMNKIANAGNSYLMPELNCPVSLAMNLFLLRIDEEKANSTFVYLYLKLNEAYVKSFANGSVTKTITKEAVRNLEIELPNRSTQNYVVEVYMDYTNKLALNRQTNQTLEQMAQTLFKSWFVDFDPVFDNLLAKVDFKLENLASDFPVELLKKAQKRLHALQDRSLAQSSDLHALLAVYQNDNIHSHFPSEFEFSEQLGWIPKGWESSNVGKEFDVTMGQSPPGSTYNEDNEGIPFFQGKTDFGFRFPSNRIYCTAPKRVAQPNDTLVSVRAPVGTINLAAEYCAIGRGLAAVRHKSGSISFTYYAMNDLAKHFEVFEGEGTVFGSINQKDFNALPQRSPSSDLVSMFNKFCEGWDQKIQLTSNQIKELTKLRDTLLPKLISGELQIPDVGNVIKEVM
jgi:type I restriction enzyme S subunit